jgi:hypothetical protein
LSTNPVPTAVPRPPQPRIPRRKAELAAELRATPAFRIITLAAVADAAPRNCLRLIFSFELSTMIIPPARTPERDMLLLFHSEEDKRRTWNIGVPISAVIIIAISPEIQQNI